jgi:thiol:disulfide interchange protein
LKFFEFVAMLLFASGTVLTLLLVPLLLAAMIGVVLRVLCKPESNARTNLHESVGAAFGFGVLAMAVGIVMALSREAAVSNVVPAVLTFIGGIALYLVKDAGNRVSVVMVALSAFSVMLLFGTLAGSSMRLDAKQRVDAARYDLPSQTAKAELEFQINTERLFRGLDPITFDD